MKEHILELGGKFRAHWKNYVFQSLFATCAVAAVLLLLNIQERPIIIASIGATAFLIFALPNDTTASSGNVIGGHLIGLFSGSLVAAIAIPEYAVFYQSLAVGLAFFLMVITHLEHPPAAGTALGIAGPGFSVDVAAALMTCVLVLSLVHRLFRGRLRDLR
jgi:CBS-domain-containing membrane protein